MEDLFCHELISVLLKNCSVLCEKRFNVMRTTLSQIRLCIHIILSEPLFAVWILPRPKEKYALFPVTCPKILGSVGRQTFFFYKNFFVWKKYENP